MKILTILFLIMFCYVGVNAQEIESTVKATINVNTNFNPIATIRTETLYSMGIDKVGSISMNMNRTYDGFMEVNLRYWGDLGCCLNLYSSRLLVTLTNGDTIEFMQVSETDCTDSPSADYWLCTEEEYLMSDTIKELQDIMRDRIQLLKRYDWKTIRIHGRCPTDIIPNSTREIKNPEQFFRQHLMAIEEHIELLPF